MKRVLTIVFFTQVIFMACKNTPAGEGEAIAPGKKAEIDSIAQYAFKIQYDTPKLTDSLADVVKLLSEENNYPNGVAKHYYLKSSAQQQWGNYDSAIRLAEKALEIFKAQGDKEGMARCYNDIGIDYDFLVYHAKAIENYLKALKIYEELGDIRGQTNAYNNIGIIHENQANYNEALKNYRMALELATKSGNIDGQLNAKSNMGSTYKEIGNYDSAITCFWAVLEEDLKSGNKTYIASSYNNVGEVYIGLGDYDKAIYYLEKAKKLKEELGNRSSLANTLMNIGDVLSRKKEYASARENLLKAVKIAGEQKVAETEKGCYILLHRLEEQTGNYKAALDYYKKAEKIGDEISLDKKDAKISRMEKDFEVEKAKREVDEAENEKKTEERRTEQLQIQIVAITIIGLLLLVVVAGLWIGLKQYKRNQAALLEYQKKLEAQNKLLEESHHTDQERKQELEKALAARSRFLSFMSHEIRTPLNGIMGLVELLKAQPMLNEQEEFIDALKRSADNLMLLLNNVLDLSKLETGHIELENEVVEMRKIFDEQQTLYKANALLRGNTLETMVDDDVPTKLKGDPYRLAQVLSNLVNNALKFTKSGTVQLRCTLVGNEGNSARLLFEVIDTGIGIAEIQLKEIMQPFTQAESYTTRKYGGSGLGLTIVNLILRVMGSELKVESTQGKGTRFYFEVDLERYRPALITVPDDFEATGDEGLEGKKVLVVEDNTTNVLLITKLLEGWKVEYNVADNGNKAIEFAKSKKYDLILMDLHLPKISGYEIAQQIKTTEIPNQTTPILTLTAADRSEVEGNPLRKYLDEVAYKPVSSLGLLNTIKRLL